MKKLFTNDRFFLAMVLISVWGEIIYLASTVLQGEHILTLCIPSVIRLMCMLVLWFTYKAHNKNAMKGMMGAILMALLLEGNSMLAKAVILADKIIVPIYLVCAAALFISHFVINSTRHPSPASVKLNQILAFLLAAADLAWYIVWIPHETAILTSVADCVYGISFACLTAAIVCVESRLDAYRLDRENAGWTEEMGYPEEYVHPSDRK